MYKYPTILPSVSYCRGALSICLLACLPAAEGPIYRLDPVVSLFYRDFS